jgi:D-lyxose ketol-isomerase
MKRSEINTAVKTATEAFSRHGWVLPPNACWDVTDFGLGDFTKWGLVLVNLAEQPEYCEKIMYVGQNQITPCHCHKAKKEDIICRWGRLAISLEADEPTIRLQINGEWRDVPTDPLLVLEAGERVTLTSGVRHAFWAVDDYAIVGEVSTANDDTCDNFFDNPEVGRFSEIEEDEPPVVKLVSD